MERVLFEHGEFKVVECAELPGGRRLRFHNRGTCCWRGGTRVFSVYTTPRRDIVEYDPRGATDESAQLHVWDDSHEQCHGQHSRSFTQQCLEWLRDHLLSKDRPSVVRGLGGTFHDMISYVGLALEGETQGQCPACPWGRLHYGEVDRDGDLSGERPLAIIHGLFCPDCGYQRADED